MPSEPSERLWIRDPLAVYGHGLAAAGGVVLEGNRIAELLGPGEAPAAPVAQTLDARRLVLIPGLINTHHHCYQTLTRALTSALNKPLFPWLRALYPVWAGLTGEMVEVATELALAELLLSGATTVVDHHYVFGAALTDAIDRQVAAAQRLGVRVVLTRGSMSLGVADGGLPPQALVQSEAEIQRDSERLVQAYHDPDDAALVQIALAPCSPFSVTQGLLEEAARLAEAENLLLHTHLAETIDEEAYCLQATGYRPLEYLERCGWLTDRSWFAHGIHFSTDEIRQLGQARCGISHCPTSNMLLSSGCCPVASLEAAGAPISLGVDGSASNDASNLMQELRQALLLQRLRVAGAPSAASDVLTTHLDVLRWGTLGGAQTLRRASLGRIEVGACADLALFSLDQPRFSGADDPLAALVLCGAHQAEHVFVDGRWRVRNGVVEGFDLDRLRHRHGVLAGRLRQGAG